MINPNKRMMVAPPMAEVVHTMLVQVLFGKVFSCSSSATNFQASPGIRPFAVVPTHMNYVST
jgi:hypothetical protein